MELSREGVVVRGLTRSYGSHKVLDNLDMNVEPGSIYGTYKIPVLGPITNAYLALLGPSGSGKTTLLKVSCLKM